MHTFIGQHFFYYKLVFFYSESFKLKLIIGQQVFQIQSISKPKTEKFCLHSNPQVLQPPGESYCNEDTTDL